MSYAQAYAGGWSANEFGMGDVASEAELAQMYRVLHSTAAAMAVARQQGNVARVQELLQRFQNQRDEYLAAAGNADALSPIDATVLAIGDWAAQAAQAGAGLVEGAGKVVGTTVGNVLAPLKGILIPALLIVGAYFVITGRAGRGRYNA